MGTARPRRILKPLPLIGICTVGALSLVSCGDDETSTPATTPEVAISDQWARTSPSMATAGAVYMTLTSAADDKLVAAEVDASVARSVEIHETAMTGGEMSMHPVEFIELPAGTAVNLEPGGYHIMVFDLMKPLVVGDTIMVTLVFEDAGEITIDVPVQDEAPSS